MGDIFDEGLAEALVPGARGLAADCLELLSRITGPQDRAALVMQKALQSLSLARESGDQAGAAEALSFLALAAVHEKSYDSAHALSEGGLDLYDKLGDAAGAARCRRILELVAARGGTGP